MIRDKAKFLKLSKKKVEKDFLSMSSLKSWVYEEDIGKMCAFLISEDALRISGQIIGVNGNEIRLDWFITDWLIQEQFFLIYPQT